MKAVHRSAQRVMGSVCLALLLVALSSAVASAAPTFDLRLSNDANEVQAVYVEAGAGEFRLDFGVGGPGVSETGDIPATATAEEVESALNALTNISSGGGSVSVTQPAPESTGLRPYLVEFSGGPLAMKRHPLMTIRGGTTPLSSSPFDDGLPLAYVATRVPGGVSRSDERIDYTIRITNGSGTSTGVVVIGDKLTCIRGNWFPAAPNPVPTFSYEWRRNGGVIPGATEESYVASAADAGSAIQCVVIGSNANATTKFASLNPVIVELAPATSPPTAQDPKVAGSRPTIAGTGTAKRTCTPPANWIPAPPDTSYSFQWLRNSTPIAGATSNEYTPEAEDTGKILQCEVIGTTAGAATVGISNNSAVGTVPQPPNNAVGQTPSIADPNQTSGPVTVELELPAGAQTSVYGPETGGAGWNCSAVAPTASDPAKAICTRSDPLGPGQSWPKTPAEEADPLRVAVALGADAPETPLVTARVSGGGALVPATALSEFTFDPFRDFGFIPGRFSAGAIDPRGEDYTQAGGHPAAATTSFSLERRRNLRQQNSQPYNKHRAVGQLHDVLADIPPGFLGNPQAVPDLCETTAQMLTQPPTCPPGSVVGEVAFQAKGEGSGAGLSFKRFVLYAMVPERGAPAQFAAAEPTNEGVYVLTPRLRPEDGYAISIDSRGLVQNPEILDLRVTLCGYGANVRVGSIWGFASCKKKGDPGSFEKPFLTSQTECASNGPVTRLSVDSWQERGNFKSYEAVAPKMTGCELVPFEPKIDLRPTVKEAEAASGLEVDLSIPTKGMEDPDGLSQSHLKRTTVMLPPGMSVNPGAADGLAACTQAQFGMVDGVPNNEPVNCPDASKLGTAEVRTPILEEVLEGSVYLAKQGENPFGSLMALYVAVESKERGVLIKLPGKVEFRDNGQLVSTFDDNPQAPFSSLKLRFSSGPRATLLTPAKCGTYQITSEMTPWSAQDPDNPTPAETRRQVSTFNVESGPGGTPCPDGSLRPKLKAGLTSVLAGSSSPFVVSVSRDNATQRFRGLDLTLPPGLTASLRGVPYCPDAVLAAIPTAEGTGAAELANPSCPEASKVGSVSVGAGAGNPFYVNTGRVYLAGPYKGAPVSMAVVVPAVAGPFDLGNVVVRNAAYVNPKTAQITVKSDPLPTVLHGVPLDVRDVRVTIDRTNFMLAPTSCEVMAIDALVHGESGISAPASNRFQVGECGALGFKPNLKLQLKGATKRNKYQQLTAILTPRPGDANIAGASVRFPRSIFLAQNHIRTVCTRVQFAVDSCPPGSIYGEAEAETPLLDQPLKGPVYLRSSDNPLPDLVVALRGPDSQPIEVELAARTDSKNRGIRNTFDFVPDAPVSKFTLRMRGGKKSLLVSSRNLCLRKERAIVKMRGQNGKVRDFRPLVKVKCKKNKKKQARRGKGKKSR